MKTRPVRIQFDLRSNRYEHLQKLMTQTGIGTNKELFENALTLMEWAVQEVTAGHTVGVKTPTGFERLIFAPLVALTNQDNAAENKLANHASTQTSSSGQSRRDNSDELGTGEPNGSVISDGNHYQHQQSNIE